MAGEPFTEDDLLEHVRGTAPRELSDRIAALAARDPRFKAELALMRGLGPALKAGDAGQASKELGWRRLEAAIRRDGGPLRRGSPPRQMLAWRAAAVLFGIAALGQAGFLTLSPGTVERPTYRTASGETEDHVLGIAFAADASAREIGDLLRDVGARVIDGPSALGLYRVAFGSSEDLQDGQAQFRASPLIDLIAEE